MEPRQEIIAPMARNITGLRGLAQDQAELDDLLQRRQQGGNVNNATVVELLREYQKDIKDALSKYNLGLVSYDEYAKHLQDTYTTFLGNVSTADPLVGAWLGRRLDGKTFSAHAMLLEGLTFNGAPVGQIYQTIVRNTERAIRLNAYEDEIKDYIGQSKRLLDNLPPKLMAIVSKLKDEQTIKYKELKDLGKQKTVDARLTRIAGNIAGAEAFIGLLKTTDNKLVDSNNTVTFLFEGFPRAFYVKLPSIIAGVPHDLMFGRMTSSGMEVEGAAISRKLVKKYMHVRNLSKRVYNFKYKAWWGPMTPIVQDASNVTAASTPVVLLRIGSASEAVLDRIQGSNPVSMYNLPSADVYKQYVKKLEDVRSFNFKVKRTVQRFMRNKMARFLNTDKQIVQEIGEYTGVRIK